MSDNAFQLQHVGVVKLAQDPCFTQEHPPLPVRRPPAKRLHRYQHLPATQRTVTTSGHLTKLSWCGEEVQQITLCGQLTQEYNEIEKTELQAYLDQSPPRS